MDDTFSIISGVEEHGTAFNQSELAVFQEGGYRRRLRGESKSRSKSRNNKSRSNKSRSRSRNNKSRSRSQNRSKSRTCSSNRILAGTQGWPTPSVKNLSSFDEHGGEVTYTKMDCGRKSTRSLRYDPDGSFYWVAKSQGRRSRGYSPFRDQTGRKSKMGTKDLLLAFLLLEGARLKDQIIPDEKVAEAIAAAASAAPTVVTPVKETPVTVNPPVKVIPPVVAKVVTPVKEVPTVAQTVVAAAIATPIDVSPVVPDQVEKTQYGVAETVVGKTQQDETQQDETQQEDEVTRKTALAELQKQRRYQDEERKKSELAEEEKAMRERQQKLEEQKRKEEEKAREDTNNRINNLVFKMTDDTGACIKSSGDEAVFAKKFRLQLNDNDPDAQDIMVFGVFDNKDRYKQEFVLNIFREALRQSYNLNIDRKLAIEQAFRTKLGEIAADMDNNNFTLGMYFDNAIYVYDYSPVQALLFDNNGIIFEPQPLSQGNGVRKIRLDDKGYVFMIMGDLDFWNALNGDLLTNLFGIIFGGENDIQKMVKDIVSSKNSDFVCNNLIDKVKTKLSDAKPAVLFAEFPGSLAENARFPRMIQQEVAEEQNDIPAPPPFNETPESAKQEQSAQNSVVNFQQMSKDAGFDNLIPK